MSRSLAVLAVGMIGTVLGPGCAQPDSELYIRQVLFRKAPDCVVRANADELSLTSGAMDASLTSEYQATLLVGGQLVARGSADVLRTETSRVSLRRAEVTVLDSSGNTLDAYSVPITGFVDQAEGTDPAFGLATVTLVSSAAAKKIAPALPANPTAQDRAKAHIQRRVASLVRIFGNTLGGKEVQSDEFQFIVFVCRGCLVSYPPGVDADPTDDKPDCSGASATPVDSNSIVCIRGQDAVADCRLLCAQGGCPTE